ncbi:MAG: MarR family transcriptional regulator, partial [Calditrichota bacterium]
GSEEERRALDVYIKLMRAANSVTARLTELKTLDGLSISQFGVLEALYHLGPMHQKEIGRKILKSSGNITMVVNNLEEKGLVERRRDQQDHRFIVIYLTNRGRSKIEGILPDHVTAIRQIMQRLTPKEQTSLGDLCKKLGRAAQTISGES